MRGVSRGPSSGPEMQTRLLKVEMDCLDLSMPASSLAPSIVRLD